MLPIFLTSLLALSPLLLQEEEDLTLSRLYVATSVGAYVSFSWGEQWLPVENAPAGETLTFSCLGPQVFAGGTEGLFFSADFGIHWVKMKNWSGPPVVALLLSSFFGLDPTLFAGTMQGLYRSNDAGESWQAVGEGIVTGRVHDIAWPGPSLFVAASNGLFVSEDSGDEWKKLEEGLPKIPLLSLAISGYFAVDPVAFVGTDGDGLYHTRDGGETFARLEGPVGAGRRVYSLYWWKESLFAGTDAGLFISQDAGESWESAGAELESRKVYRILVPAPESNRSDIILGTDRGVFKSSDGALSWRHPTDGLDEPAVLYFGSFPVMDFSQPNK